MKRLYAPWRDKYVTNEVHGKKVNKDKNECIFCTHISDNNDEAHYILKRGKHNYIMMNLYPYNAGHLLIVPYAHQADLNELSSDARQELIEFSSDCSVILKKALQAEGINIGLNLGKASGAGMPSHLHMHVLPRWVGDTNFMPVLAETKQISSDLNRIYKQLQPYFK